ncbi:hypothetical protein V5O48_007013 [Marasmius crinis-equi]|uniref:Uncharacterized protein n=1 Tax=Marasmius crinis-equi TaxID=585013 RepID=A0ABR3FHU3_9AGAR
MSGTTTEARQDGVNAATMPSQVVEPGHSDTAAQQASTQPGDGTNIKGANVKETTGPDGQPLRVVEVPAEQHEVPFKDQVIGYAKKTRGTVLNKPDLKEHGEQILQGTATVTTPGVHHETTTSQPHHETS